MFDAKHAVATVIALVLLTAGLASIPHQSPKGFLGLVLAPLTRAAQARAPFLTSGGALIVNVVAKSAADRARIKPGAILMAIDGRPVASAEEAADLINKKRAGDHIAMRIYDLAQDAERPATIVATLAPNPPLNKRIFHVDQPRTLARERNFLPAMAANAAWARRIARGAVTPFPLSRYEGRACSALAPEGWSIVDDDPSGARFALASPGRHVKAIYVRMKDTQGNVDILVAKRLAAIFRVTPQTSAAGSLDPDLRVTAFGTVNGYAGFVVDGADGEGNTVLRIAAVPASDAAGLEPVAGAVALSIRCGSQTLTHASAAAPTSVSVKCLEGSCDDGDLAGAYNETLHVGYVHSATGENFMIDPRKDIWETGPDGPGTYRQVSGQLEKLEPGRTN